MIFGVQFPVMPPGVIDMLACWKGRSTRNGLGDIWSAVRLCLKWTIWWERNHSVYEDSERTTVELKIILIQALYDWMATLSSHSFSFVLDFIHSCP